MLMCIKCDRKTVVPATKYSLLNQFGMATQSWGLMDQGKARRQPTLGISQLIKVMSEQPDEEEERCVLTATSKYQEHYPKQMEAAALLTGITGTNELHNQYPLKTFSHI